MSASVQVEALCDRIAILSAGKVECSGDVLQPCRCYSLPINADCDATGTLLELKAQHGAGYSITAKFSSELSSDTLKLQERVVTVLGLDHIGDEVEVQKLHDAIVQADASMELDAASKLHAELGEWVGCGVAFRSLELERRIATAAGVSVNGSAILKTVMVRGGVSI